jgi:hypothetical protein
VRFVVAAAIVGTASAALHVFELLAQFFDFVLAEGMLLAQFFDFVLAEGMLVFSLVQHLNDAFHVAQDGFERMANTIDLAADVSIEMTASFGLTSTIITFIAAFRSAIATTFRGTVGASSWIGFARAFAGTFALALGLAQGWTFAWDFVWKFFGRCFRSAFAFR